MNGKWRGRPQAKSITPNHFSVMQPGFRITALARRAGITGGREAIYAWAKSIGWKIETKP